MSKKKKENFSLIIPTIYLLILFVITAIIYLTQKVDYYYDHINLDNITFVSSGILNRSIPVVNIPDILKSPVSDNIKLNII